MWRSKSRLIKLLGIQSADIVGIIAFSRGTRAWGFQGATGGSSVQALHMHLHQLQEDNNNNREREFAFIVFKKSRRGAREELAMVHEGGAT